MKKPMNSRTVADRAKLHQRLLYKQFHAQQVYC